MYVMYVQQKLSIPLKPYNSEIPGFGETVVGSSKGRCYVTVKSRISDFKIKTRAIVVPILAHFILGILLKLESLISGGIY